MMRYVVAIGGGTAMAVALLLLMHSLVQRGPGDLPKLTGGGQIGTVKVNSSEADSVQERAMREAPPRPKLREVHLTEDSTPSVEPPELDIDLPQLDVPAIGSDTVVVSALDAANLLDDAEVARDRCPPPRYPSKAMRMEKEGWVTVKFTIRENGTVTNVRVVDADPWGTFDQAARQAISQCTFHPRLDDGRPVKAVAYQTYEFKLDGIIVDRSR